MQMLVAASGMNRDQANTLPAIELKKYCDEMLNPAWCTDYIQTHKPKSNIWISLLKKIELPQDPGQLSLGTMEYIRLMLQTNQQLPYNAIPEIFASIIHSNSVSKKERLKRQLEKMPAYKILPAVAFFLPVCQAFLNTTPMLQTKAA